MATEQSAKWISGKVFALTLAGLIALLFYDVVLGLGTFVIRDYSVFAYPLAHYHRECFWRGEIPLWNPYNNFGIPFLAQWSTMVLYPGSLIYLMLPLPWSLGFFCLVHTWFGGMGMYLLARRWTANSFAGAAAGLAFALSGFALNCLMWPAFLAAVMWMPWVVWRVVESWGGGRRLLTLAVLAGGAQMMTGAPEVIFLTWLFIGILWFISLFSQPFPTGQFLVFPITALLVAGLSAAQFLPFLDLLRDSQRSAAYADSTWSMPASGWANFLVPLFRFYRAPNGVFFQLGQDWTSSYYMGAGVILLTVLALVFARSAKVWTLICLTIVTLLLAFGENSFAYPLLRKHVPQLGFMRFPVKFVLFAAFSLPLLAGFGIKVLDEAKISRSNSPRRVFLGIGAALILAIFGIVFYAQNHPVEGEIWQTVLKSGLNTAIILLLLMGAAWYFFRSQTDRSRRITISVFLIVMALDCISQVPSQNPRVPLSVYATGISAEKIQPPPRLGESRAMMTRKTHDALYGRMLANPAQDFLGRRLGLFGNTSLIDRIPNVDGFYPLYLRPAREVWSALFFNPDTNATAGLANLLGVSSVSHPTEFLDWLPRDGFLPIISVGARPIFLPKEKILEAMSSAEFRPKEVVFLDEALKPSVAVVKPTSARVEDIRVSADSISARIEATDDALVVISQSYSRNWRAMIDRVPTPVMKADHGLQAIQIPSGTHSLTLTYVDRSFLVGSGISVTNLLILAGIWLTSRSGISKKEVAQL